MRSFCISDASSFAAAHLPTELIEPAFERALIWTAELLSTFFGHCRNPILAATSYARRRVRRGDLHSARLDLPPLQRITGPLAKSRDNQSPDYEKLSYFALKRLLKPSKPTTVYWPSASFARAHGAWTGTDKLPNPAQMAHAALCTATWLYLLCSDRRVALNCWTSEQELQFLRRRDGGSGPIPDGLIRRNGTTTAIEVLGAYPADWISHHVERFEQPSRGWEWALF